MMSAIRAAERVVFRVDASLQMGTGHMMRCLTLADALKARGAECHFLCREHPGNLFERIKSKGHAVHVLPDIVVEARGEDDLRPSSVQQAALAHAHWLGTTQEQDADASATLLRDLAPDWLIVDHYALDVRWEKRVRLSGTRLMAIDDLADRQHECDLLLDQNLGRTPEDYAHLVPADCRVLTGPKYALLRPEFAAKRSKSLRRRRAPRLQHLMISMGGVDSENVTGQVLKLLRACQLPKNSRITVVMGAKAPSLQDVRRQASAMAWPTEVLVDVSDMADLMADADLAIGAAGSTSWERCCLGLPTIMVVLAENQWSGARALQRAGAVFLIGGAEDVSNKLPLGLEAAMATQACQRASGSAASITDGLGISRALHVMHGIYPRGFTDG